MHQGESLDTSFAAANDDADIYPEPTKFKLDRGHLPVHQPGLFHHPPQMSKR